MSTVTAKAISPVMAASTPNGFGLSDRFLPAAGELLFLGNYKAVKIVTS
jgi:hypothetical protein